MISTYKLLNKCDKFTFTTIQTKRRNYCRIALTTVHRRISLNEDLLKEYDTFFKSTNGIKRGVGWDFDTKENAESAYTWAILKWG